MLQGYLFIFLLNQLNSSPPNVPQREHLVKISILIKEGIIKKNSYERRDYESVDEKSLTRVMSRKTVKRRIHVVKG